MPRKRAATPAVALRSLTLSANPPQTIQTQAAQWAFDFCDRLVFPTISIVRSITVTAEAGAFPVATARAPVGCTLLVESSVAFTGTVTVEVDSSDLDSDYV